MSLTQPYLKMSKSHGNPKSRILITDSREGIKKKIKNALTDSVTGISHNPEERPGVSNLLEIMYHLQSDEDQVSLDEMTKDCEDLTLRAFKERVVHCIDHHLEGIRESYLELTVGSGQQRLDDAAEMGTLKAKRSADRTMNDVRNALGL